MEPTTTDLILFFSGIGAAVSIEAFFHWRTSRQTQLLINTLGSALQNVYPDTDFRRDKKGNIRGLNQAAKLP